MTVQRRSIPGSASIRCAGYPVLSWQGIGSDNDERPEQLDRFLADTPDLPQVVHIEKRTELGPKIEYARGGRRTYSWKRLELGCTGRIYIHAAVVVDRGTGSGRRAAHGGRTAHGARTRNAVHPANRNLARQ